MTLSLVEGLSNCLAFDLSERQNQVRQWSQGQLKTDFTTFSEVCFHLFLFSFWKTNSIEKQSLDLFPECVVLLISGLPCVVCRFRQQQSFRSLNMQAWRCLLQWKEKQTSHATHPKTVNLSHESLKSTIIWNCYKFSTAIILHNLLETVWQ